jgi:flavodoxin
MKTLILYASSHHGNTKKIAQAMGKVLKAKTLSFEEFKNPRAILKYDLIGFGSGIYWRSFDKKFLRLINRLPSLKGKKVFLFSTSGSGENIFNRFYKTIKAKLAKKHCLILGDYNCRGFDTMGVFGFIGGLNKGRPNQKDLAGAKAFAKKNSKS